MSPPNRDDGSPKKKRDLPLPGNPVGLKKKLVVAVVAISVLGIGVIILFAVSSRPIKKNVIDQSPEKGALSDFVAALPSDYSKLSKLLPTLPSPQISPVVEVLRPESNDEALKIVKEYELLRLKRRLKARDADVVFSEISSKDLDGKNINLGAQDSSRTGETSLDPTAPENLRDAANRQDDKIAFLAGKKLDPTSLNEAIKRLNSPYEILSGAVIPGVLLTGINSDLPGQISGQVSQNVYDSAIGNYLLIPQGTKVIGEYDSRVSYGQERVLIVWTRVIFPNGKSINLEGLPGVDLSGSAGLADQVNNHYAKILTGVVFGSVLGAGAQVARGSNRTVDPSFGQLTLEGGSENINEAGQEITRKNINIQPTLEIRPGFRFNIFVTRDITLEPYGN